MAAGRPQPSNVVKVWMRSYDFNSSPKRITIAAAETIMAEGWAQSIAVAGELASKWESRLSEYLRSKCNEAVEMGWPARLCFNSSATDHIQGSCFIEPLDDLDTQNAKSVRASQQSYYDAINSLTPEKFEQLCAKTIGLLGVTKPNITRRSADEGIDFYGKIDTSSMFYPADLYPTIQRQLTLWIVGQAKHYLQVQSGTAEVRELVGSLELARARCFSTISPALGDLSLRPADPVFLLLITSGSVSRNAWTLLKASGVLAMDGTMLAAFLADRQIAVEAGIFSKTAFDTWVGAGLNC
jgi:Restriction endonuclease